MLVLHHDIEFELPEEWLHHAGITELDFGKDHYPPLLNSGDVFLVSFQEVEPLIARASGKGIFCDNEVDTAQMRVNRILTWLRANKKIEPVQVVRSKNQGFNFKLVAGCHRFHCALALGYKRIPAIEGFDISDPYA